MTEFRYWMQQDEWDGRPDKPCHMAAKPSGDHVVRTLCGLKLYTGAHPSVRNYEYVTYMEALKNPPYSKHPCCPECLRALPWTG